MAETIIETILKQISQLTLDQQLKLRHLPEQKEAQTVSPLDKRIAVVDYESLLYLSAYESS